MEAASSVAFSSTIDTENDGLTVANLELRPRSAEVLVDGKRAGLTVREFQTLYVMVQRRDRVLMRAEIYALVWGGPMSFRNRSVDVFVRKIRRKLMAAAPEWRYVHTHFGVGYRFSPERR